MCKSTSALMNLRYFFHKLSLPILLLSVLLQRSPVVRFLADLQFSLMPRVQHLWTVVAGAVSVGAYNTVTGASGDVVFRANLDTTTVSVGEEFRVVIEIESNRARIPETWVVDGDLPAGLKSTINFGLGIVTIDGIPTEAGSFPITVQAWEGANKTGDKGADLDFIIRVTAVGPVFTQQPSAQSVSWGDSLNLSSAVETTEGTEFQWQRILTGEVDYTDIDGATASSLVLDRITSADEGMYRVIASDAMGSIESSPALVSVNASAFQQWKEESFEDPFSEVTELDQDPDEDQLINAVEFMFGLDPSSMQSRAFPKTTHEVIDGAIHAVYAFPPLTDSTIASVVVEGNPLPNNEGWSTLVNGVDGVVIDSNLEGFFIKVPAAPRSFSRIRIVTQ
jgi:hypothetical protein